MPPGGVDDVRLDDQVGVDEIRRIGVVGVDAADLCGRQVDLRWPLFGEKSSDRCLVGQVQLGVGPNQDVLVARRRQGTDKGGAHHAAVAGDVDGALRIGVH